jgi:hypothetical protein
MARYTAGEKVAIDDTRLGFAVVRSAIVVDDSIFVGLVVLVRFQDNGTQMIVPLDRVHKQEPSVQPPASAKPAEFFEFALTGEHDMFLRVSGFAHTALTGLPYLSMQPGLCKSISDATSLRAGANSGTLQVPAPWAFIETQLPLYDHRTAATPQYFRQYVAHIEKLHADLRVCKATVNHFEEKQQQLCEHADDVSDQAVVARDQLRRRAIHALQMLLHETETIQHAEDAIHFSTCAERFDEVARRAKVATKVDVGNVRQVAITPAELQAACTQGVEATAQWRRRHDATAVIAATDTALESLWQALAVTKGSLKTTSDATVQAVTAALTAEYTLLSDVDPLQDFPLQPLTIAAKLLIKYCASAATRLKALHTGLQWADRMLTQYHVAQSIAYPPSLDVIVDLRKQLAKLAKQKKYLQVDIEQPDDDADIDDLKAQLAAVQSQKKTLAL